MLIVMNANIKTLAAAIARKGNTLALVSPTAHSHINRWGTHTPAGFPLFPFATSSKSDTSALDAIELII